MAPLHHKLLKDISNIFINIIQSLIMISVLGSANNLVQAPPRGTHKKNIIVM
jgi:hypothetical protein